MELAMETLPGAVWLSGKLTQSGRRVCLATFQRCEAARGLKTKRHRGTLPGWDYPREIRRKVRWTGLRFVRMTNTYLGKYR